MRLVESLYKEQRKKIQTYNPKKFLAIKDQLNKYRKLKKAIQLKNTPILILN